MAALRDPYRWPNYTAVPPQAHEDGYPHPTGAGPVHPPHTYFEMDGLPQHTLTSDHGGGEVNYIEPDPIHHSVPDGNTLPSRITPVTAQETPQDEQSVDWTQAPNPKWRRTLGTWDVSALILNKMIGAGFFTLPGLILQLTGSKKITIVLWFVGGVYSMLSFVIYLEYGYSLPFNGGDLIYLDRAYPSPKLFASVVYSAFFIAFATTAGNTVAFARLCISAAAHDIVRFKDTQKVLINLVAVSILTVVCLLLYFSKMTGRALNRLLMLYKIGLFISVFAAGKITSNKLGDAKPDDWDARDIGDASSFTRLSAFIYIIYAYQGWENANYVGGEIKDVEKGTLRNGGLAAIFITMVLYILGTLGYFWSCTYEEIVGSDSDLGMGQGFALKVFGHTTGFKACIALSAVGNLIAVIYTNSMVKQSIALQRFIPFWHFVANEDTDFGTPRGAIFLQWFTTIPLILAMPKSIDGYGFIVGIYSYLHVFVLLAVGIGLLGLRRKMNDVREENNQNLRADWEYSFLKSQWIRVPLVVLFVGMNIIVLYIAAAPRPHRGPVDPSIIPKWKWPVIAVVCFCIGALYWLGLYGFQEKRILSRIFGVDAKLDAVKGTDFDQHLRMTRADGTRYRMSWVMKDGGFVKRARSALLYLKDLALKLLT